MPRPLKKSRPADMSCADGRDTYREIVAPLGAGHMAQSGADQHEGGVAVRETAHHPSAAADVHLTTCVRLEEIPLLRISSAKYNISV